MAKKCCTWPRVIIIVLILAVAGVLIWLFAPIDENVNNIVPPLNGTFGGMGNDGSDGNEGGDGNGGGDGNDGGGGSTSPPVEYSYEFIQCQDMSNCCNGLEEICDLGVDDILWATSHNAMATRENGFIFGYNHLYELESSLKAGYRCLSLDVCNCGGEYQLCHGICDLGARDPTEVFTNIISFMQDNPTELIMINLQVNSEVSDEVSLNDFSSLLNNVPGFGERLYVHDPTQPWPTLRTLTDSGQTILLFHFNGPDCTDGSCPNGFHYWFNYAAETDFAFTTASDFADTSTSCKVTRGSGSTREFFGVNSFVTPPTESEAETINSSDFLGARLQACSDATGLDVNLMYVDFWNVGDLPEVVQTYNKALGQRRKLKLQG